MSEIENREPALSSVRHQSSVNRSKRHAVVWPSKLNHCAGPIYEDLLYYMYREFMTCLRDLHLLSRTAFKRVSKYAPEVICFRR
jgi:hypothetical protein